MLKEINKHKKEGNPSFFNILFGTEMYLIIFLRVSAVHHYQINKKR